MKSKLRGILARIPRSLNFVNPRGILAGIPRGFVHTKLLFSVFFNAIYWVYRFTMGFMRPYALSRNFDHFTLDFIRVDIAKKLQLNFKVNPKSTKLLIR